MRTNFRIRFSIRALLAGLGLLAVACAYVSREVADARAEDSAIRLLESVSVSHSNTNAVGSEPFVLREVPGHFWPRFIHWLAGSSGQVSYIRIFSDQAFEVLAERAYVLRNVKWLEIIAQTPSYDLKPIRQEYVVVAGRFPRLDRLALKGSLSDDLDLSPLTLHRIGQLRIESERFSLRVLEQLSSVKTWGIDLSSLDFDFTFPTEGFRSFKSCTCLRSLSVLGLVDDKALELIAQAPNLQYLSMGPMVSDAGLRSAQPYLHVYQLNLVASDITDSSIATLASMKELRILNLKGTKISPEGIEQLRAMRPDLSIAP